MMWSYGMGWFGWTLMVAWWVFVVVGIVWLVRTVTVPSGDNDSARRLLDQRFAAGELSIDEYRTRRRALG
ncbi:MAG: SHOCT domain-containing protein [Microthrixaceae bacterium]